MRILNIKKEPEAQTIKQAIKVLNQGGLIIYPTETCYGLGADATNPEAVNKVLQFKGERKNKPILIAVADQLMAEKYVKLNQAAKNLYQKFLPGPVAVVSRTKGKVDPRVESQNQTLGIRIPNYPLVLKLIKALGKPITSTSANTSGKKQPYSLKDIKKYTSKKKLDLIDLVLDGGELTLRPTSTVVDTTLHEPTILRQGEITLPNLPSQTFISGSEEETKKIAQRILERHQGLLSTRPIIFALQGELGAGKTQFAKGLGRALKIKANISSPTFVFLKEYPNKIKTNKGILYHLDTWRMQTDSELEELGFTQMLKPNNIIAIEWLQKVKSILDQVKQEKKAILIWITIETISPTKRRIKYQL